MRAFLKNYRQSPRKVRLVANLIKGKNTKLALSELDFLPKRAGFPIKKLLLSAIANATSNGISKDNLYIKELRVDKGIVMKRMMPAAMGTGHRINKRTSHITLLLAEKVIAVPKTKSTKKVGIKEKTPARNALHSNAGGKSIIKKPKKLAPKT